MKYAGYAILPVKDKEEVYIDKQIIIYFENVIYARDAIFCVSFVFM